GVRTHPEATFYLAPTSGWELLLGGILALASLPLPRGRLWREVVPALGILLILAAAVLLSEETAFPGMAAVPPCLGAALLIYAGRPNGGSLPAVTRVLSTR